MFIAKQLLISKTQGRSGRGVVGGGRYPWALPRHAPTSPPPLEPEAGSNLFNSKLTYIQGRTRAFV